MQRQVHNMAGDMAGTLQAQERGLVRAQEEQNRALQELYIRQHVAGNALRSDVERYAQQLEHGLCMELEAMHSELEATQQQLAVEREQAGKNTRGSRGYAQ